MKLQLIEVNIFTEKNEKVIVYKHFAQRAPIKIGQKLQETILG